MISLFGKPPAELIHASVQKRVATFKKKTGHSPCLTVLLIGEDPASLIYVKKKKELATQLGITHHTIHLPKDCSTQQAHDLIQKYNEASDIHAILIQRPLPPQFSYHDVLYWIHPNKDVDAFHPLHAGQLHLGLPALVPCTPMGILSLFKFYKIDLAGKVACVVGRSSIVGKPMASLLLQANATVLHCHRQTHHLSTFTQQADILIVAIGQPEWIDGSYIKPGAILIDVGIHQNQCAKKITGDIHWESASKKATAITPVPGGVGLMTLASLMENTITLAEKQLPP